MHTVKEMAELVLKGNKFLRNAITLGDEGQQVLGGLQTWLTANEAPIPDELSAFTRKLTEGTTALTESRRTVAKGVTEV